MRSPVAIESSHSSRRKLAGLAAALAGTAIASSAVLTPAPAVAHPSAKPLLCRSAVTVRFPSEDATTIVVVKTVPKARVTTSAHYRTTTNTESTKANRLGLATIPYDVSDATKGWKVLVTVHVQSGRRAGNCRTSYTPE